MSETLYDIEQQYRDAMERAEEYAAEHGGELSDALCDALDKLADLKQAKIGRICRYIKSERAAAKAILEEVQSMAERASAHNRKAESLAAYLAGIMQPREQYEDAHSRVSWRKSERVVITGELDALPREYVTVVPETRRPNKAGLKKAIKAGKDISGVELEKVDNIQIK